MNKQRAEKLVRKTREDYNAIAPHFSSTRSRPWHEMKEFAQYVQPGQRVLDVGCGNGRLLDILPRNTIYTGLDLSDELVEQARVKHLTHPCQPQFVVGDMRELPFDDESFHHVFVISSLYHVPSRAERQRVVAEIARVLKPGGYVFMTNWDLRKLPFLPAYLRSFPQVLLGRMGAFDLLYRWKDPKGTTVVYRYAHAFSCAETRRLLKSANLAVHKQWRTNGGFFNSSRAGNIVTIAHKESDAKADISEKIPIPEAA